MKRQPEAQRGRGRGGSATRRQDKLQPRQRARERGGEPESHRNGGQVDTDRQGDMPGTSGV
jgi:hypothetical protein